MPSSAQRPLLPSGGCRRRRLGEKSPPQRRKLHIRWLLLPFQTVTASLGHSLGRADRVVRPYGMLRIRKKPFARHHQDSVRRVSSDAAAVLFFLKEEKEKNGGAKKRAGNVRPYRERQKRKHPPLGREGDADYSMSWTTSSGGVSSRSGWAMRRLRYLRTVAK